MMHSWGSRFVAIIFSFITHTENHYFVGTGIRGLDPPRKTMKMGTPRKLSHSQYNEFITSRTHFGENALCQTILL